MPDFPPGDDICGALEEHVRRSFVGREIVPFAWTSGRILDDNPHFRALRVAPAVEGGLWTYVSVGGWAASGAGAGLEFVVCLPDEDPRGVELLALIVHYHRGGKLGVGHTAPIGEAWLPGSRCDHLLVSDPYPFEPGFWTSHVGDRHVDFAWLLPITAAERTYKVSAGQEALETLFEDAGLRYWDVDRPSLV